MFTEEDWSGIRKLHTSVKAKDPLKVGRFGLGFKSVFHITDHPVIISGDSVMYMDPFKDEATAIYQMPLKALSSKENQTLKSLLVGVLHVLPQHSLTRKRFKGTLFWFPLRQAPSELSGTVYSRERVQQLKQALRSEVSVLPLFLKKIERVAFASFLEIETDDGDIHTTRDQWMVVNFHHGLDDMSPELRTLCQDKSLTEYDHLPLLPCVQGDQLELRPLQGNYILGEITLPHTLLAQPCPEDIIAHLQMVISKFSNTETRQFSAILYRIYTQLTSEDMDVHGQLSNMRCILNERAGTFHRPSEFWAREAADDLDLKPHRFLLPSSLSDEDLEDFFLLCGCRQRQDSAMLNDVLHEIQQKYQESSCSKEDYRKDFKLVVNILETLKKNADVEVGEVLLPVYTTQKDTLILRPARECTVAPDPQTIEVLSEEEGLVFVHPDLHKHKDVALALGAIDLRSRTLTGVDNIDLEDEEYGQREALTTRLRNLLQEGYTDGFCVPKELLQNADDAGARVVKLLLDERENPDWRSGLITPELSSLQGPAIWAYNDAMFTDTDFTNICKLGGATKKEDCSKAVYNLTEVPTVYSGTTMAMLDPHETYLEGKRGKKMNFNHPMNKVLLKRMPNQFRPFQGIFGTEAQAERSEICKDAFSKHKQDEFIQSLMSKAGNLMLFLQNVQRLELYRLTKDCKEPSQAIRQMVVERQSDFMKEKKKGKYQNQSDEQKCRFHIVWATGVREAWQIVRTQREEGFVPLAAIAVPLDHEWNAALFSDAIPRAYLASLHKLESANPNRPDYYSLWPHRLSMMTEEQNFYRQFTHHFYALLVTEDYEIFPHEDGWVAFSAAWFFDPEFKETDVGKVAFRVLQEFWRETEWKTWGVLVDVPHNIVQNIRDSGQRDALQQREITEVEFFTEVLFPRLSGDEGSALDVHDRNLLVLHALMSDNAQLQDLVKCHPCIPCQPDGSLNLPSRLVNPYGSVAKLFEVDDGRFPQKDNGVDFCSHSALSRLHRLGMVKDRLPWEDLLERANSVKAVFITNRDTAMKRCDALVNYFVYVAGELSGPQKEALSTVKFLPVMPRPKEWPFPWFGEGQDFVEPRNAYGKSLLELVACQAADEFTSEFGQCEPLTRRINRLLEGYTRDCTIFKELLQNADDAGATEVRFVKDFRRHPVERVLNDGWKEIMGPALCVYNDASFSQKDMKGIQALGEGSKEEEFLKTGRYGVGFNAVYNLTDTPCFWTRVDGQGETVCLLDPNRFVVRQGRQPGMRLHITDRFHSDYSDMLRPFILTGQERERERER
nr:hypothetical protein BaRGS_015377 [Batillaria attramentaria]